MKYYSEEQLIEFGKKAMCAFSPNNKIRTEKEQDELWQSAKKLLELPTPALCVPDKNPFLYLNSEQIDKILKSIRENFSKHTLYNETIHDYSEYIPIYNELLKYVQCNFEELKAKHVLSRSDTYGDMVVKILNDYGVENLIKEKTQNKS